MTSLPGLFYAFFTLGLFAIILFPEGLSAQEQAGLRRCFGQVSISYISDAECAWIEGQTVQLLQRQDKERDMPCNGAYRMSKVPFRLLDRVHIDQHSGDRRYRLFIARLDRCKRQSLVFTAVTIVDGQAPQIALLTWRQAADVLMQRSLQTEREQRLFTALTKQFEKDLKTRKAGKGPRAVLRHDSRLFRQFADVPIWRAKDLVHFVVKNFWDLTPDYWLLAANYMVFTEPENAVEAYAYADMVLRYTARRCSNGGESRVSDLRAQWSLPPWLGQHDMAHAKAIENQARGAGTVPVVLPTDWICNPPSLTGQSRARATDPVHPEHLWQRIWVDLNNDLLRDAALLAQPQQRGETWSRVVPPVF